MKKDWTTPEAMEIGKEMKGKIRVDLMRMDVLFQRHLDKVWMSQKMHEEVKDWEIDCSKLMIRNHIATGTFGSVYKAVYDGKDVAVKVVGLGNDSKKAALRKIFMQELTIWNKLEHPNIAKFIGTTSWGISDLRIIPGCGEKIDIPRNACGLVVEYLPGGTLKSYLIKNRIKKLPFNAVIQLALDIAKGLSYLHSQKIVHRDVKTENMLLDEALRVKITDFGVSRTEALNPVEMAGQTGTLGYMAPEVLSGSPYDHKCDVYSFGICLWEIFCCAMPYSDMNSLQKTSAVVYKVQRPEIPKFCPRSLSNIMKQCWDANPEKRPEMEEVVHLLESIDKSIDDHSTNMQSHLKGCLCLFMQRRP